jgi:flagellar hook-associated protein 3 FlgL
MRITNQTLTSNVVLQLQQLASQQAQLQNQVSTGLRISQPEDDPEAIGSVLSDNTELDQLQQFALNANQALQVSQSSYSSLQSIKSISDRAGQLATLGASATAGASALQAYGSEMSQLVEQAVQEANAKYGNNYLFSGTAVTTPPFTVARDASGQITGITYAGNAAAAPIPLSATSSVTAGTDGTTNAQIAGFLNNLVALRNALQAGDSTAVSTTAPALNTSEDDLINAMGEQSAVQARIEAVQSDQTLRFQNVQKEVSDATSADLAATSVKLSQTQTAYQAAAQSAASIMKMSLLNYLS